MATISRNEIARYAAKNIVMNNVDMLTATSKGMALEAMKKRMMRGECVRFAYLKKDQSVRVAYGTMLPALISNHINGRGTCGDSRKVCTYFDVEVGQFRCFQLQSLIKIW